MFKVPFIEQTGVGIEIAEGCVRWIEVDRLGNKLTLSTWGEIEYKGTEESFCECIEQIKDELKADAYQVGLSIPEVLQKVIIEEVPYSEEEEEIERWIKEKVNEISTNFENHEIEIQHQIIELDEDNKRCLFQVFELKNRDRFSRLLLESEIYPTYISGGLLEPGYAQIYNPEFSEGTSAVISRIDPKQFLILFEQGLVKNVYELSEDEDSGFILSEADSYLQSEEANLDLALHSIPLFISSSMIEVKERSIHSRSVIKTEPLVGKKGFEKIPSRYSPISGLTIKLFFPNVDSFNGANQEIVESAILQYDKKEALRTAILLFAPLIFFGLITYALGKFVDYQLVESNQIMGQIGSKIEEVSSKRTHLLATRDQFVKVKTILEEQVPVAHIFEMIGNIIPQDVWLTELDASKNERNKNIQLRAFGYSKGEASVSIFLNRLEELEEVSQASLIVSEKVENKRSSQNTQELTGMTRFELNILFTE